MAAHCKDKSPAAFLLHADRVRSSAVQVGNADVSAQGAADLLLQGYRDDLSGVGSTRGLGLNHFAELPLSSGRRQQTELAPSFMLTIEQR